MKKLDEKCLVLHTQRLMLRPPKLSDASFMVDLLNDKELTKYTTIPHPYELKDAKEWIEKSLNNYLENEDVNFAIILKETNSLIGAVGLDLNYKDDHISLGYWLAKDFWNLGYMPEATSRALEYAFKDLDAYRVAASHFNKNPASGKVMQKIGMKCEGTRRGHFKKAGEYLDVVDYGIMREEFIALQL